MKKYIFIPLILVLFSFASCTDLDKTPIDQLNESVYWKTLNDAEMYITQVYKILPGGGSGGHDGDANTDNARHGIKWAQSSTAFGVYDPLSESWSSDYENIRICNVLLERIENVQITSKEQQAKDQIIAQARFFRAYIYFTLIRSFGDVPYIDKEISLAESYELTRNSKDEIYKKIMEDLDYAIEKLPTSWAASADGRITSGGAEAMKARVALQLHDYATAATSAKKVIDSKKYELFDKDNSGRYAELFWERTDEGNPETILTRKFDGASAKANNYLIGWSAFPTKGWGGINPTQSLVDAFECIDGSLVKDKPAIYDEKDPFKNRDIRLETVILHDGEELYGATIKVAPLKSSGNTGIAQHNDATATGYYNQKFLDPAIDPQSQGWSMGKDGNFLRFAEVLLTYAEAKNEVTPLDDSAFEAVNRVRTRVGQPSLQKNDSSKPTYCGTQDAFRQRIRNEWRVEFACEYNTRYWDIRRWKIAEKVMNEPFLGIKLQKIKDPNAPKEDNGEAYILYQGNNIVLEKGGFAPHNYLSPIPQREIDMNSKLKQNPNY